MARTKQTARLSVGGKAPRKRVTMQAGKRRTRSGAAYRSSSPEGAEVSTEIPKMTYDVTYETSFYSHYFRPSQYGKEIDSTRTFMPKLSLCRTTPSDHCPAPSTETETSDTPSAEPTAEPASGAPAEYWLGVNFTSKYDGPGMDIKKRPLLNFAFVLDISGSMGCSFSEEQQESKLEVAKQSLLEATNQLQDDDYFTFIIFNESTTVVQHLSRWGDIDKTKFEASVNRLRPGGGTELSLALSKGAEILRNAPESDGRYNRICILTDMMANGSNDEEQFVEHVQTFSQTNLYTTIVGVGMDLALNTVEQTSRTPGCNYCNVRSAQNFSELMNKEFSYLVTPIAFNVELEIGNSTCPWKVVHGYGSPEVSSVPLEDIKFSSDFPSSMDDEGKGLRSGCYVFKIQLENTPDSSPLPPVPVSVSWDNMNGIRQTLEEEVSLSDEAYVSGLNPDASVYSSASMENTNGLRKSILLIWYTDFVLNVIRQYNEFVEHRNTVWDGGLSVPQKKKKQKGDDDEPVDLTDSAEPAPPSAQAVSAYVQYLTSQVQNFEDPSLMQEVDALQQIQAQVVSVTDF